jgi:hypothetical protein
LEVTMSNAVETRADRLFVGNRPASELDDDRDRDELRQRYYGLLQELRILLPGIQVFVAFLLTAPFAQRFGELDELGRAAFGVSLIAGVVAVIAFVTPTAFHRFGDPQSRSERLKWAIRTTRIGIAFMALSLLSALFVVCRMIYGTRTGCIAVGIVGSLMALAWLVLPLTAGRTRHSRLQTPLAG